MSNQHAVVWIDQHEAKIFRMVDDSSFEKIDIECAHHHVHRHPRPTAPHEHPADAQRFFHDVAVALADVSEILIVGPATAKLELIKYVHKHEHALEPKIVGVETVDHPTDRQMVEYARRYFRDELHASRRGLNPS